LGLLAAAHPSSAEWQEFGCRAEDGTEYRVLKMFWRYEGGGATCYNGAPWCITTVHGSVKLDHFHFVMNFTSQEQLDANRFIKAHFTVDSTELLPTTSFNCHAYGLYLRDDIWITGSGPGVARTNDFDLVPGTECEPYAVGDLCNHAMIGHSSRITTIDHAWGWGAANAAAKVIGKWGGYGKYRSDDDECYMDPSGIYREKP